MQQGTCIFLEGNSFPASIARLNPDGSFTTVAGGGQPPNFGYVSSPDGPALPSVIYPALMAFDAHGDIGFVDSFTPVACCNVKTEIREVTAASQLVTLAGGNGQIVPGGTPLGSIWFDGPSSIAFSQSGDLYVAQRTGCKIWKIGADGSFTTFAGNGTCAYPAPAANAQSGSITPPLSVAVDPQNRVWVADGYVYLYNIAQDGTVSPEIKTPVIGGTGQIAVDGQGRVDVIGLDSLYRVLPDFSYTALVPLPSNSGGWNLWGIGTDTSGNVYVAGGPGAGQAIYKIDDDGSLSPVYQNAGNPRSLAVDAKNRVWGGAASLGLLGPAGTQVLGDAHAITPGDGGPVNSAEIDQAASLVFSPSGALYFIDGNRIRSLTGIGTNTASPSINAGGIVNAASYAGGAIAPQEFVSIFGSNFAAPALQPAAPENNFYPVAIGRTQVFFNGIPAPITALAPGQINAIVPAEVANGTTASVQVEVDDTISLPTIVPVAAAAPSLWTANLSGSGEAAVVNADGSVNSTSNPAPPGSVVSLHGTGLGALPFAAIVSGYPLVLPDGALTISTPYPQAQGVTVAIGGEPATILYAGAAPFLANGVTQINVRIPSDLPPANATLAVSAGGLTSSQNVTVAVK